MTGLFQFSDDLGPAKVIGIYEPRVRLKAILVVDNVAAGPAIGGARMAPDVSLEECFRLARAMTLKNAAAGLPHGGGKSVIFADPRMPHEEKERMVRAFGRAIGQITDYIVGPDMGTNEESMAWIIDEIGRAVGLPREIGGIPLDEIGATGFGISIAAEAVAAAGHTDLAGARVVIQGYGAVGRHVARFLADRGSMIVAVSDSRGATHNPNGLALNDLDVHKQGTGSISDFGGGTAITPEQLIGLDCEILVPAARPDVINAENAGRVQAKLILQGANIPATREAEQILHQRGILSIPDFVANAGGVICASVEFHGGNEKQAFDAIAEKISRNVAEVLAIAERDKLETRTAAERMATGRVARAMSYRRV
ncbi:MAG: Glu/Leu/Phe/Val family dehydrogenase [Hyphomicrobiaceae bacterium]